jgi:predicted nucleotidyltransferase
MEIEQILKERRGDILKIASKHGAENIRIFGSTLRGDRRPESDLDLLVDVKPVHSSWFPASFMVELESFLGLKVDIVTPDSIHWYIRDRILKEARPL